VDMLEEFQSRNPSLRDSADWETREGEKGSLS
jgi:hypothetical protein